MSYVRLVILDFEQTLSGEVHGNMSDAVVASLSAEPQTIRELESALSRFARPSTEHSPFANFRTGQDLEPFDAGIVIVDLAVRIVVSDSTYSLPGPSGEIAYHDGEQLTAVRLPYLLSDEWHFVNSVQEYEDARRTRQAEGDRLTPFDVREVLYGKALCQFIAKEILSIPTAELAPLGTDIFAQEKEPSSPDAEDLPSNSEGAPSSSKAEELFAEIHAKWLVTKREDLGDRTPREILLAKKEFVDFDLHSRELQWSFTGECPPPLPHTSHAYRLAGFGIHEVVIYYDLIRHLINESYMRAGAENNVSIADETKRLEEIKAAWLETSNSDYLNKTP